MWLIIGGLGIAILSFYLGNILGYNAGYEDGELDTLEELGITPEDFDSEG